MNELKNLSKELKASDGESGAGEDFLIKFESMVEFAQKYPRDLAKVEEKIKFFCSDVRFAEVAMYERQLGKDVIRGPSIRMAEDLMWAFGHIDYYVALLSRTPQKSIYKVLIIDKQDGRSIGEVSEVSHTRYRKDGGSYLEKRPDQIRDMYEASKSKTVRNLILKLIPNTFIAQAKQYCEETLKRDNNFKIQNLIKAFVAIGVSQQMIEEKLGVSLSKLDDEMIIGLRVKYNSIKNGDCTAESLFGNVDNKKEEKNMTSDDMAKEFKNE